MFFVYILRSKKDSRFYIGMSQDVTKRLIQHNSGKTKSTKAFKPWILLHTEEFKTRQEARDREKYLKSGIGRSWIYRNWPRSSAE
jgi:putative endonuclease